MAVAGAAAIVAFGAPPVSSSMHLALKRSEPGKDCVVMTAPTTISLWYTARPNVKLSKVTIMGASGIIATGTPTMTEERGAPVVAPITGKVIPGTYTVTWLAASSDGHAIRGTFNFTYKPVAAK